MPNINLPIHSLSVLFLFGSIALMLWFPDKPFTPDLAHALFWWFLALGVVRWIETGIKSLFPTDADDYILHNWLWLWHTVSVIAFGFFAWFLVKGIFYFFSVLAILNKSQ